MKLTNTFFGVVTFDVLSLSLILPSGERQTLWAHSLSAQDARVSIRTHSTESIVNFEGTHFFWKLKCVRLGTRSHSKTVLHCNKKRSRAFFGKDVMTQSWKHGVLIRERKQTIEVESMLNTSTFDDKCETFKIVCHATRSNWTQKDLNCKRFDFVHKKQNYQSWHPNRCACFLRKNFAFCFWVSLVEVSFQVDKFEISRSCICSKICFFASTGR